LTAFSRSSNRVLPLVINGDTGGRSCGKALIRHHRRARPRTPVRSASALALPLSAAPAGLSLLGGASPSHPPPEALPGACVLPCRIRQRLHRNRYENALAVRLAVNCVKKQMSGLGQIDRSRFISGFLGGQRWDMNPRPAIYEAPQARSGEFASIRRPRKIRSLRRCLFTHVQSRSSALA
jgi:hypothetical protein